MIDAFMKQFSKELELENPLTAAVPGVYTVPLEDDLAVSVTQATHGILFSCIICHCPKVKIEEFFSQAMLANLYGQGTKGAVLGTTEEGNQLTLTRLIDYNIDYKGFRDILEDFINTVDFWREETISYK